MGTVYDYSSLNRLTNMTVLHGLSNIASYAYTVAPSGHRIAATETILRDPLGQPTTLTRLYSYDRTYRLTNETIGGSGFTTPATLGYAYDKVGNRLQLASTLGAISSASYSYDANDRLNTSSAEQFDNNGNTLFASGFGMTQADQYDFENRLVLRTESGRTIQIVYDGDGNRVKKTVTTATNTVTTWFLVDTVNPTGYAQVLEEHVSINSQASAISRVYAYGHDLISQDQVIGNQWQVSFYGYDGHGNVRFLTDANGFLIDTYDYDAFGNLIAHIGSTANNYRFTGEQFDSDLSLYFLRARYQNTSNGRFWTMDELLATTSAVLNGFSYVKNDPVGKVDPSGLFEEDPTIIGRAVHQQIQLHFEFQPPQGCHVGERAVSTITGADYLEDARIRPDLVDICTGGVYETKPIHLRAEGIAQLATYL